MAAYSVLTYNIGGYEILHEVRKPSPNAEYIYVTDDRSLTSSTWTMVYVDNPYPQDPFWLCYQIRFNPFNYVNTDIVLRIDGSMSIGGDTDWLIDEFVKGGYDIALLPHPHRQTASDEYDAWVRTRGTKREQANRVLGELSKIWDVRNDKGLYAFGFMIQRNNGINNALNKEILNMLLSLAPTDKMIERCDQVVGSVVINLFELKPMMLRYNTVYGRIIALHPHHSTATIGVSRNAFPPYFHKVQYPWAF